MDVRHLAFLARQPSAVLQPRESFLGMPKRGLAFILANAIFWQPLLVQAEGIVVSGPGTSLGAAGNGVPIVNIAAPNGSGLSHNQFNDYNVGTSGLILNNATDRTQATQLGGIILGNPNLQGNAANIILNEVNGTSPSQLRGYTEVAGHSAKIIVANPYGITCNGCGFINTPNVTLTTGKPILDNGRLDRYQVDGGAVTIDGQGLNASNVDSFEIITRTAKINAQINARNLTVIAGRNDVSAQTLAATARVEDGSAKPDLAIDSSVLGGMYAGAIKLVGSHLSKKVAVHAIVGGLIGEAAGGDFRTSALAAGANEALIDLIGEKIFPGAAHERVLAMTSQLIGMTVAAAAGGDAKAQEKAAWVAQQATVYNHLEHAQKEKLAKQVDEVCKGKLDCIQNTLDQWKPLADKQNVFMPAEQAQYDQAQGILTDKLLENCLSDFCRVYTLIEMKQAGLNCADISCLRESAGATQKAQYLNQKQWGKLILDAVGDGGAIAGALAPVLAGGSKVASVGAKGPLNTLEGVPDRVQSRVNLGKL